jgi:hypothetical protein
MFFPANLPLTWEFSILALFWDFFSPSHPQLFLHLFPIKSPGNHPGLYHLPLYQYRDDHPVCAAGLSLL